MKGFEQKLDTLIEKVDGVADNLAERYATKADLLKVESRIPRMVWVTNTITAIVSPIMLFLVMEFLKSR